MKLIIDIPDTIGKHIRESYNIHLSDATLMKVKKAIKNGTPLDNATNGDAIKTMFGDDKVTEFMGYVQIMARVGNWFNDGVVAEFNKDWWNAPYRKDGEIYEN